VPTPRRRPEHGASLSELLAAIRWRLVGWSLLVIVIVLAIAGVTVYAAAAAGFRDQVDRDLAARADSIAGIGGHEAEEDLGREGYLGASFQLVLGPRGEILANPQNLAAADLRALSGTAPGYHDATVDREPARVYVRPFASGDPAQLLLVGRSVEAEREALARLVVALLASGAGAVVLAIAGGWFLAGRALVPIALAFHRQRDFVADASHELRTPLTVIRAAAELLDRHGDEPLAQNRELLDDLRAEVARMERLAEDLLTLARSDARELALARGRVDLAVFAADAIRRARALAEERGVALEHQHEGAALVVDADPDRLAQALLVLVDNALRHTPPGGHVSVRTRRERGDAVVRVRDDGEGVAPADLPHVFDRFYRAGKARTAEGGAGLGLAIARALVRAHGGELSLESAPGAGTTATIRLPIDPPTG